MALGRKEKTSFHATLTFSPGPRRKGCVNPGGGCSCQNPPLQDRQELWEGVSAMHCITLRRSRPEKHVCQGRAEVKATPGKCFKDGAAPCGLHPLELGGRTSPSQSIHARKPCPKQILRSRGDDRPGQGPFPTEAAATDGKLRHALGSAGW